MGAHGVPLQLRALSTDMAPSSWGMPFVPAAGSPVHDQSSQPWDRGKGHPALPLLGVSPSDPPYDQGSECGELTVLPQLQPSIYHPILPASRAHRSVSQSKGSPVTCSIKCMTGTSGKVITHIICKYFVVYSCFYHAMN